MFKVYKNFSWMILEKALSLFGLIFVTSSVARYMGPSSFGVIAFSAAIFTIVKELSLFGSDTLLFKRISQNPKSGLKLMLSVKYLRGGAYLILSIPVITYFYFNYSFFVFTYCVSTCLGMYFLTQDVISIYHDATLNSKLNTLANLLGIIISLIMRFLLVYFRVDVIFLCIPIILTTFVPYIIRKITFKNNLKISLMKYDAFKFNVSILKYSTYMVLAGLPLAISSVSISLYTKLSQIFLVSSSSTTELGIYSAASTLATVWNFITLSFITSMFVIIYQKSEEDEVIQFAAKLNGIVLLFGIAVFLFTLFFGQELISLLYGDLYVSGYQTLIILSLASIFSAMGPIAYRLIIKESGFNYLLFKTLTSLIINIPLSFYLISCFNILGASSSILITEFLSLTILNYFFKRGLIFKVHRKIFSLSTYF